MTNTKQRLAEALEDNKRLSEHYHKMTMQFTELLKKYEKLKKMLEELE